MRYTPRPADEDEFTVVQERLVDEFCAWALGRDDDIDPRIVDALLEHQWSERGGDLSRLRCDDIESFLHTGVPDIAGEPIETTRRGPETLRAFVRFMAEIDRLGPESDESEILVLQIAASLDTAAAAADAAPSRRGTDRRPPLRIDDHAGIEAWLGFAPTDRIHDPAGAPTQAARVDAARDVVGLWRLRVLVTWIGSAPRVLADDGDLALDDAKRLVEVLHTDDPIDPVIGGHRLLTRHASELHVVEFTYRWARAAQFVHVVEHGDDRVLRPAPPGLALESDPTTGWYRAIKVLVAHGPTAGIGTGPKTFFSDDVDAAAGRLLVLAFDDFKGVDVGLFTADLVDDVLDRHDLASTPPGRRRRLSAQVAHVLETALARIEVAGLVERSDTDDVVWYGDAGRSRKAGGHVALTDLGRWGMARLLAELGYRV